MNVDVDLIADVGLHGQSQTILKQHCGSKYLRVCRDNKNIIATALW